MFIVSETKLDESFPRSQFTIDGFSTPFRLDRNDEGGGGGLSSTLDHRCHVRKSNIIYQITLKISSLNYIYAKRNVFYLVDIILKRNIYSIS